MAHTTHDLQRLLDDAWDATPGDGGNPPIKTGLREALRTAEKFVGELLKGGAVQSVSKNSASQSYAFGSTGTLTTAEVARAWRELINLFDRARAVLVTAGDASPSDEDVYSEMMARLRPIYQTRPSLISIRCHA